MKKSVAAYWVFVLSLVLVLFTMNAEANAQILDRSLSLRDLAQELRTPEEVARYLWRHFAFQDDREQFGQDEYWQSPEEFLETRRGDCEDFAEFANQILRLNGFSSFLLNVYGNGFGHTVCVFKEDGKYNVIDGTNVIRFEEKNIKQLATDIYPFWKQGAIVAPSEETKTGRIVSQFERQFRAERALAVSA